MCAAEVALIRRASDLGHRCLETLYQLGNIMARLIFHPRATYCCFAIVTLLFGAAVSLAVQADQSSQNAIDEEKLVRRITEAVMEGLRDSDFLNEQIERGIRRYVDKQREAQAVTRARQQREQASAAKNVRRVSVEQDHIYGNPDAEISLIEYSDFECPFCKKFHATAKRLVEKYDGKVNWVYRHFPLSFHNPGAAKQAVASECAGELGGNDLFWKYADAIYARTRSGGTGFPESRLVPLAEELGLDGAQFKDCLVSGRHMARIQADLTEGRQIGITGTPGNILLNNRTGEVRVQPGAVPISAMMAAVRQLLQASD
jgi:protein-disulfide isomerase